MITQDRTVLNANTGLKYIAGTFYFGNTAASTSNMDGRFGVAEQIKTLDMKSKYIEYLDDIDEKVLLIVA